MNKVWHVYYTTKQEKKYPTCIVYEYAKILNKVLASNTFLAFKISYIWFRNKIGYYIFREIGPKLTINIYMYE